MKILLISIILIICIVFIESSASTKDRRRRRAEESERRQKERRQRKGVCVSKDKKTCYENITFDECSKLKELEEKGIFQGRCPPKATKIKFESETTAKVSEDI